MEDVLTLALLSFFDGQPEEYSLACALLEGLLAALPETQVRVQKTQITLSGRHHLAARSHPRRSPARKAPRLPHPLGLSHRLDSPRVDIATKPYPGRWTHHLLLSSADELDEELLAWAREAYDFAQAKGR